MHEAQHDFMIQRGIDEALACQDMLTRSPATPARLERLQRLLAAVNTVLRGRSEPRLVRQPAGPLESKC